MSPFTLISRSLKTRKKTGAFYELCYFTYGMFTIMKKLFQTLKVRRNGF